MITAALAHLWATFVVFLGGLITMPAPPGWLLSLAGWVVSAKSFVASTDSWLPWSLVVAVIASYVATLSAGLLLKLVRVVASFMTLGGGSAS